MNSRLLIARLTRRRSSLSLPRPVRLRCSREALHEQDGMRCPAGLSMQAVPREAMETGPPPLRADASSSQTVKPSASSRAGPEPKIPRWSAERRTSRVMGREAPGRSAFTRVFYALSRLRAYVTGPPSGAAAPERLSALRFLLVEVANDGERSQTSEAHSSRER